MKLTLTRNAGGHKTGDTIEVSDGAGQHLIDAGYGEAARKNTKVIEQTSDDDSSDAETNVDEPKTKRTTKRR